MKKREIFRKLRKVGGSTSVNLPPLFLKANDLKAGQIVRLEYDLNTITVSPLPPKDEDKEST